MKILILGYSSLCKRKIIPVLKKNFGKIKFSICSQSQQKENIGASEWFRNYEDALKNSQADLVYISLFNSKHFFWAKKFLQKKYHVIIDKPATLNFKQADTLVKLAKKNKRLLSEAVVFNYHLQIKKSIKEINTIKNLDHVHAIFTIPKLPANNFRHYKKYGGGCILDMGPYAASVFRIFIKQNYKNISFHNVTKKNIKGVNLNFSVYIATNKKSFFGYFSHNEDYENTLTLFAKQNKIKINRVFSPPNDINLSLEMNNKIRKLKKDDCFLNYFKHIFTIIKTKKFNESYQNLLQDSLFREKIIK